MTRVASFHLISEVMPRAALALPRLATDRLALRRVPGLSFWRLLGTGRDDHTGPGASFGRTAMFAVWERAADLDEFSTSHALPRRWAQAHEYWSVRLHLLGGHGTWRATDPLAGLPRVEPSGPVAIVTRADVRLGAWRDFRAASRVVDEELRETAGLIDVVGIGEAPVGRLGTFSLWESEAAARAYSRDAPQHREVRAATRAGRWYSEELFARFAPCDSSGTWNGRDPLAGGTSAAP